MEQASTPTFERVLGKFENDSGTKPFDADDMLLLTRLLRAAREHYARTLDAALAREDGSVELPLGVVRGAQMLYRRIADALAEAAMRLVPRPQLVGEQSQVAELAMHSLNARAEHLKWHSFEHTRPPGRSWQRTNDLMRAVESLGLERMRLPLGLSCTDAFAQCMLLDSLNVGILGASPMELAHRWLAAGARDLRLDPFYDSDTHGYQVDLGRPSGAERITAASAAAAHELSRFLAVAPLGASLAAARSQLYAGKLSVGATANRAVALHFGAFLDVAERLWSADWRSATWRDDRERVSGESLQVVVGLPDVLEALQADAANEPLRARTQHWPIHDRSPSGLGARLPLHMDDSVPLGALIAFRAADDDPWETGTVVRRIRAAEDSVWVVGVRRLSEEPVAIDLATDGDARMPAPRDGTIAAIYAPINADAGRIDGLIVRTEIFGRCTGFILPTADCAFQIRANRVIDRGADWVRFGFEVLGKK